MQCCLAAERWLATHVARIQQVLQELLEPSQCRPTIHTGFHNGELCISLQFRNDETCSLTSTKTAISLRVNILRSVQLLWHWDRLGSYAWGCLSQFALPNSCRLSTVTRVCMQGRCGKPRQHWCYDACGLVSHCGVSPVCAGYKVTNALIASHYQYACVCRCVCVWVCALRIVSTYKILRFINTISLLL